MQAQPGAGRRHLRVRGHRVRTQVADRLEAGEEQLAAVLGEVGIPHVQRRGDRLPLGGAAGRASPAAGRLEQRGPLAQHPLVVGADARNTRCARDRQLVEEAAPLTRVPAHDREILGGEQHAAQRAQHVARAGLRRAVESRLVRPAGGEFDLDPQFPAGRHQRTAHHGALGPLAHQRGVAGHPVAVERGDVTEGFEQVGLALPVGADQHVRAGFEREFRGGPATEIGDGQMPHIHRLSPVRRGVSPADGPASSRTCSRPRTPPIRRCRHRRRDGAPPACSAR